MELDRPGAHLRGRSGRGRSDARAASVRAIECEGMARVDMFVSATARCS
jgi:hypothetical protein